MSCHVSTSYECRGCPGVVVDWKILLIWGKRTITCRVLKKRIPLRSQNWFQDTPFYLMSLPLIGHFHFVHLLLFIVSHNGEAKWPKSFGKGSPAQPCEFKPPFICVILSSVFELFIFTLFLSLLPFLPYLNHDMPKLNLLSFLFWWGSLCCWFNLFTSTAKLLVLVVKLSALISILHFLVFVNKYAYRTQDML